MIVNFHSKVNSPLFYPQKLWITMLVMSFILISSCSEISAQTIKIKDGDSFVLNGVEIRLWGIDAPEYNQTCTNATGQVYDCGLEARAFLERILTPLPHLRCKPKTRAQKETRQVSQCFVDGQDLAEIIVKNGHAIDYVYFSKGYYSKAQKSARLNGLGIWAGKFINPREWRKMKKHK